MTSDTKTGPFDLQLDPDRIVFKGDNLTEHATTIRINVRNTTESRQCFKIKCTSANIFRVRPTMGFISIGETINVRIKFTSREIPPSGKHYFMFYHKKCTEESHARQVWTSSAAADGIRKMLCYFETDDGRVACKDQYQKVQLTEHTTRSEDVDDESDDIEAKDAKCYKKDDEKVVTPQKTAEKEEKKHADTPKASEKENIVSEPLKT